MISFKTSCNAPAFIGFETVQHLKAIHLRHHHIQQNDIGRLGLDPRQPLPAIPDADCLAGQVFWLLPEVIDRAGFVTTDEYLGTWIQSDSWQAYQ